MERSDKIIEPIIAPKFLKFWSKLNGFSVGGFSFLKWTYVNCDVTDLEYDFQKKEWYSLVNHESIHYYQQKELMYLPFYIIYIGHYLFNLITKSTLGDQLGFSFFAGVIGLIFCTLFTLKIGIIAGIISLLLPLIIKNSYMAYRNVVFEKEAYDNQDDLFYLDTREKHSWKKYWNKKTVR